MKLRLIRPRRLLGLALAMALFASIFASLAQPAAAHRARRPAARQAATQVHTQLSNGAAGSPLASDANAQLAQELIAYGKKYLGTPYKFGAEYETSGKFDCSSFTQYVFKKFGYKLPRTARTQVKLGKYVPKSELQPGDLVFFKALGRPIGDVGIYIGNNQILQAFPPKVRITNLTWSWWKKNYVTARRIIGVEPRRGR